MFWAPVRRCLAISLFACTLHTLNAQSQTTQPSAATPDKPAQTDPLQRPIPAKKQREAQKQARKEAQESLGKKWLEQDVPYIITPEERAAFKQLSNDEERDQFIEAFWQRRDPTPDTVENEYKEEHYRRIAYANEHFSSGVPGWKTDRGRIYIIHGAPDQIESSPSGGTYNRSPQEGGGTTSTFPFERWRYRHLEDVGEEVVLEFVDACMCGDYHMTMDPTEKDALAHTPMGQPLRGMPFMNGYQKFDDMETFVRASQPPKVRFKDLSEMVSHKIIANNVPIDVLTNFVRVTADTVLVPIAIQIKNRDITFANTNGVERGTLNIFGRFTTLSGRVAQTFEDTVQVDIPHDLLPKLADNPSLYGKALPMRPGHYRLDIVVKDVNGDRVGTWGRSVTVLEFREDRLSTSSLIVADRMERVPATDIGTGSFVIGDMLVRPRVPSPESHLAHFKRDQKISFWMQVYNLTTDAKTHQPSAKIEYSVSPVGSAPVIRNAQTSADLGIVGDQITLQKTLPAADLRPGATYELRIHIDDLLSGQSVEPLQAFVID
jgi:GWxTD domain-containing protein